MNYRFNEVLWRQMKLNNDIIICSNAVVISLNYFKQTVLDARLSLGSVGASKLIQKQPREFLRISANFHISCTKNSTGYLYNVSWYLTRELRPRCFYAITRITTSKVLHYSDAWKRRIKRSRRISRCFIFSRESPYEPDARRNVVRVVTEMYGADIRNDLVRTRKRARQTRRKLYSYIRRAGGLSAEGRRALQLLRAVRHSTAAKDDPRQALS